MNSEASFMDPYNHIHRSKRCSRTSRKRKKDLFYVSLFFIVIRYVNLFLLKDKPSKLLFTKIGVYKRSKYTYILLVKIKTKHF